MRDTFKKAITASTLALLITLPLGVSAADKPLSTTANTPASVKATLNTISSTPRTIDGQSVIDNIVKPFGSNDNSAADCELICYGPVCWWSC